MYRVLLLALVGYVAANTCPDVTPVQDFKFASYAQGTWYEYARYSHPKVNLQCSSLDCTLKGDVSDLVFNYIVNHKEVSMTGVMKLAPDAGKTGKLDYTINPGPGSTIIENIIVYVLAVDYDNYAISYSCKYNAAKGTHEDYVLILARSKTPSEEVKGEIGKLLKTFSVIDTSKLEYPVFNEENCKVE